MTVRTLLVTTNGAGMGHLAKAVVECAGAGACTSDYSELEFKRLRRPIYPLDLQTESGL